MPTLFIHNPAYDPFYCYEAVLRPVAVDRDGAGVVRLVLRAADPTRAGQILFPRTFLSDQIDWCDCSGPERVVLALAGYDDVPGVVSHPAAGRSRAGPSPP